MKQLKRKAHHLKFAWHITDPKIVEDLFAPKSDTENQREQLSTMKKKLWIKNKTER